MFTCYLCFQEEAAVSTTLAVLHNDSLHEPSIFVSASRNTDPRCVQLQTHYYSSAFMSKIVELIGEPFKVSINYQVLAEFEPTLAHTKVIPFIRPAVRPAA